MNMQDGRKVQHLINCYSKELERGTPAAAGSCLHNDAIMLRAILSAVIKQIEEREQA